jgi:spore coat protein CotH
VPVSVTHDGKVWTNVAMRYKGNSSLVSATSAGNGKVPFRLDFSRNKKTAPGIDGQKFYGFEELTFSSNFADDSQLREVLGSEVFLDRGIPAPRAAFYRIFVDTGTGPEYWGLYTMVEDPGDGAMLDSQLSGRRGNLYKPDGVGADWTRFAKEGFSKKTNETEADFADVEAAIAALHAPRTNPAVWRAALEARFDVELFLKWLAVNTAVDNWDTYGAMSHNYYYLYGDPRRNGRLQWIPWDNNMSFGVTPFGGGVVLQRGAGPGAGGAPPPPFAARFGAAGDVLHANAGEQWPLISILMADDVYAARYRQHLQDAFAGLFTPDAICTPRASAPHARRAVRRRSPGRAGDAHDVELG